MTFGKLPSQICVCSQLIAQSFKTDCIVKKVKWTDVLTAVLMKFSIWWDVTLMISWRNISLLSHSNDLLRVASRHRLQSLVLQGYIKLPYQCILTHCVGNHCTHFINSELMLSVQCTTWEGGAKSCVLYVIYGFYHTRQVGLVVTVCRLMSGSCSPGNLELFMFFLSSFDQKPE
jgi:hypothetical protein